MSTKKKNSKEKSFKRTILEWLGIAAVLGILFITGLHTEVLGTIQRAVLWTGLFDADARKITTVNGPVLSERTYNLTFSTPEGNQVRLEDFKGKVLFINIWASWCPPCVAEMPTIETLYNSVSGNENIKFLLISMDEKNEKATDFMKNKGFSMPYYFPISGLPRVFQSRYIPSTYVISKEGKVIYKKEGIADYSSRQFENWLIEQSKK
jgi:thiol-disulfide isomerase/thioredoxin